MALSKSCINRCGPLHSCVKLAKIEFTPLKLQATSPSEPLKGTRSDLGKMIFRWPSLKVIPSNTLSKLKEEFTRLKLQTTSPLDPPKGIQPEMIVICPFLKIIKKIFSVRFFASKLLKIEFTHLRLKTASPLDSLD